MCFAPVVVSQAGQYVIKPSHPHVGVDVTRVFHPFGVGVFVVVKCLAPYSSRIIGSFLQAEVLIVARGEEEPVLEITGGLAVDIEVSEPQW